MNIALIGGGTQLPYSIDIIEKQNIHNIVGIIDSIKPKNTELFNFKVIGKQENILDLIKEYNIEGCVITIGDNWTRRIIYEEIAELAPLMKWPNAIHPSVIIGKNVVFGKGILIMAGVIISLIVLQDVI